MMSFHPLDWIKVACNFRFFSVFFCCGSFQIPVKSRWTNDFVSLVLCLVFLFSAGLFVFARDFVLGSCWWALWISRMVFLFLAFRLSFLAASFYFVGDCSADFLSRFRNDFIFIIGRNCWSAKENNKKKKRENSFCYKSFSAMRRNVWGITFFSHCNRGFSRPYLSILHMKKLNDIKRLLKSFIEDSIQCWSFILRNVRRILMDL